MANVFDDYEAELLKQAQESIDKEKKEWSTLSQAERQKANEEREAGFFDVEDSDVEADEDEEE